MYLIAGLGNPGKKYDRTRHNVGCMVVETLAKGLQLSFTEKKIFHFAKNDKVIMILPTTFMNESGKAVAEAINFYKIPTDHLVVVHDDLDITFGIGKLQKGKSDAGHNGVKSIIESLGTEDFWRLRIGIASENRGQIPGDRFVLSKFSDDELQQLLAEQGIIWKAADGLAHLIDFCPEQTASLYNKKPA